MEPTLASSHIIIGNMNIKRFGFDEPTSGTGKILFFVLRALNLICLLDAVIDSAWREKVIRSIRWFDRC
jgi:hypothetical protein